MSRLLINEHPLMVLPTLAKVIGLNEAIVLQQIHYWIDPRICKNKLENKYWVYNSYEQWGDQFPFFSTSTIKRAINNLEKQKLVISQVPKSSNKFDKRKWYTINYNALNTLESIETRLGQNDLIEQVKITSSKDQVDMLDKIIMSQSSGHNESIDGIKMNQSLVHNEPLDKSKMTSSIYSETETTTEITTEKKEINSVSFENIIEEYEIRFNSEKKFQRVSLSAERKKKLSSISDKYMNSNINQWKHFFDIICQSDFLMGKTSQFKVHFDWMLKEENILKTLEGAYNNPITEKNTRQETDWNLEAKYGEILKKTHSDRGKEFYILLKNQISLEAFVSWFSDVEVYVNEENTQIELKFSNEFKRKWVLDHYNKNIKRVIQNIGKNYKVIYTI